MMIGTVVLYMLILICWTLTLIQGHRSVRKQKLLQQLSQNVCNQCEWNLVYY